MVAQAFLRRGRSLCWGRLNGFLQNTCTLIYEVKTSPVHRKRCFVFVLLTLENRKARSSRSLGKEQGLSHIDSLLRLHPSQQVPGRWRWGGSGLIPGAPGPGKAKGQHRVEQPLEKGSTGFHPNPRQPTNISCPRFLHLYNSPFLLHKDGLQIGSSTVPGHIQALIREEWTHICICMYIHMYACMCACMYTLMHTHIYT